MNCLSIFRLIALIALVAPEAVYAVDGVILIDQSKALAGNVTPGDSPGFPVTISQPGSYRLDSNLVLGDLAAGIEIDSDNVTIDLNGFTILGPATCSFVYGVFTCFPPSGLGIYSPNPHSNLTIRNGFIQGMAIEAIYLSHATNVLIDHLQINQCGLGISAQSGIIRDTLITYTGWSELLGGVIENVVLANGPAGLYGNSLTIRDSVFGSHGSASFVAGEIVGFSGVAFIDEPAPLSGFSLGQNTLGGAIR